MKMKKAAILQSMQNLNAQILEHLQNPKGYRERFQPQSIEIFQAANLSGIVLQVLEQFPDLLDENTYTRFTEDVAKVFLQSPAHKVEVSSSFNNSDSCYTYLSTHMDRIWTLTKENDPNAYLRKIETGLQQGILKDYPQEFNELTRMLKENGERLEIEFVPTQLEALKLKYIELLNAQKTIGLAAIDNCQKTLEPLTVEPPKERERPKRVS